MHTQAWHQSEVLIAVTQDMSVTGQSIFQSSVVGGNHKACSYCTECLSVSETLLGGTHVVHGKSSYA